jgi:hypothetical protein
MLAAASASKYGPTVLHVFRKADDCVKAAGGASRLKGQVVGPAAGRLVAGPGVWPGG